MFVVLFYLAIVLSNHGGRQLDTTRSGIEVLPEVMAALRKIGAEKKMEVRSWFILELQYLCLNGHQT